MWIEWIEVNSFFATQTLTDDKFRACVLVFLHIDIRMDDIGIRIHYS